VVSKCGGNDIGSGTLLLLLLLLLVVVVVIPQPHHVCCLFAENHVGLFSYYGICRLTYFRMCNGSGIFSDPILHDTV
jgi:hypothetical protein